MDRPRRVSLPPAAGAPAAGDGAAIAVARRKPPPPANDNWPAPMTVLVRWLSWTIAAIAAAFFVLRVLG